MNPTIWNYLPAALLIVLGALFAWIEQRTNSARDLLPPALCDFAMIRSRRRVRIAALLIFVGVLMVCGNATDPHRHPLRYLLIWGFTALLAVSMLFYGIYDFYATRVLWVERMRQSAGKLGTAARQARVVLPDAANRDSRRPQEPADTDAPPSDFGGN